MSTSDKQFKIDIPESLDSYKLTLFWGLTITQIVLAFVATLFIGFAIFSLIARHLISTFAMVIVSSLVLLGMVQVRGRNFYQYLLFIFTYYKSKPKVLIYSHAVASGRASLQAKQLVYQKESNTKLLITIVLSLILGLLLLVLIGIYLSHVLHK